MRDSNSRPRVYSRATANEGDYVAPSEVVNPAISALDRSVNHIEKNKIAPAPRNHAMLSPFIEASSL